jgi:hypothetical protein
VQALGNVTVFRYGNGTDPGWSYGYRHMIVFDKLSGYNRTATSAFSLFCSGSAFGCNCQDATAAFVMNGQNR